MLIRCFEAPEVYCCFVLLSCDYCQDRRLDVSDKKSNYSVAILGCLRLPQRAPAQASSDIELQQFSAALRISQVQHCHFTKFDSEGFQLPRHNEVAIKL